MKSRKNISSLHVPHNKHTAACVPVAIMPPDEVVLPMNMHSGGHAEPIVKVGDYVYVGQLIAREEGRFSSPVHATVSGTVVEIAPIPQPGGKEVVAIRIQNDKKMTPSPDLKVPEIHSAQEFLQAVRDSGVVGLGGAAFPTWAKFNEMLNPDYKVDTVLINAAECEPYITSDHRMMVDHPELIDDPRFVPAKRWENRKELYEYFREGILKKPHEYWVEYGRKYGLPIAHIAHFRDVSKDPQAWANGYLEHVTFRNGNVDVMPASPVEMESFTPPPTRPAPPVGAHTVEILRTLGYTDEQIDAMIAAGAAITPQ